MNNWLDQFKDLKLPSLSGGPHASPEDGLCAMEMVAFIERLPHSASPECTCYVLANYVISLNDRLTYARDNLLPYLPRLVGTVSGSEHQRERAGVAFKNASALVVARAAPRAPRLGMWEGRKYAEEAERMWDQGIYTSTAAYCAAAMLKYGDINLAFSTLDEMLAIGPQGKWSQPIGERLAELAQVLA